MSPRKLIVCCDGTWDTPVKTGAFDGLKLLNPTNVARLAIRIKDRPDQVVGYFQGIANDPNFIVQKFHGFYGIGLNQSIIDAYTWLATNYQDGDELYFFGFSRGAFTARSLVGFIRNCGLVDPRKVGGADMKKTIEDAYYLIYRVRDDENTPWEKNAKEFRNKYSYEGVALKFLGVWDTVGHLGIPLNVKNPHSGIVGSIENLLVNWAWGKEVATAIDPEFHDTKVSNYLQNAYQALCIEERRKPYLPTMFEKNEVPDKVDVEDAKAFRVWDPSSLVREEAWFLGYHASVGGGFFQAGYSNLALEWMVRKAAEAGLVIDDIATFDGMYTPWLLELRTKRTARKEYREFALAATDPADNPMFKPFGKENRQIISKLYNRPALHRSVWTTLFAEVGLLKRDLNALNLDLTKPTVDVLQPSSNPNLQNGPFKAIAAQIVAAALDAAGNSLRASATASIPLTKGSFSSWVALTEKNRLVIDSELFEAFAAANFAFSKLAVQVDGGSREVLEVFSDKNLGKEEKLLAGMSI